MKPFIEDQRILIKRFKNRLKFELFIHNKPFRESLQELDVSFPGEEAGSPILINKKIIYRHSHYGLCLQTFFKYFELNLPKWNKEYSIRFLVFLEKEVSELKTELTSDEDITDWEQVYLKLRKRLETLIFESQS